MQTLLVTEKFRILQQIDALEELIVARELESLALPSVKGFPHLE